MGNGVRSGSRKTSHGFGIGVGKSSHMGGSGQKPKAGTRSCTMPVTLVMTKLPTLTMMEEGENDGLVNNSVLVSTRILNSNSGLVGGK